MPFANFDPDASGQAAFALVAGLLRTMRDLGDLERDELVMVFEHALKILPESAQTRDIEAREAVAELLKELVPE